MRGPDLHRASDPGLAVVRLLEGAQGASVGIEADLCRPKVIPFFAFSPEVRKIIYTTNAIENLHSQVRKAIRNKGHFPSDEAAAKLIYLALRNIAAK